MNAPQSTHAQPGAQPWSGLRVVERDGLCSAYATRLWAALGAEVVVLEPPQGHQYRHLAPFAPRQESPEGSLWWAFLAQNKRSVVVEPGSAEEAAVLAAADVVFDEPLPGAGLTRPAHDGQVAVTITPFGARGPRANWRGSDLVAWASSGLTYVTGFPDRPPVALSALNFAAHITAMHAVGAAMVALYGRRLTGRGQAVDISMQLANTALHPEIGVPLTLDDGVHRARSGNRRAVSRPWGLYPCTDGFASIIIVQPAHWMRMAQWLLEVTGMDAITDPAFNDMAVRWEAAEFIDGLTEELTTSMSKQELFVEGQRRDIPITPVNTVADLARDPHLEASGFWRDADHPVVGRHRSPGSPFTGDASWWHWTRAPLLDEHTADVLSRWGGAG
jgi:crotonobetainyl-CoA:carnitine CoA-transferase CaiB-like acyl-CoA transferase